MVKKLRGGKGEEGEGEGEEGRENRRENEWYWERAGERLGSSSARDKLSREAFRIVRKNCSGNCVKQEIERAVWRSPEKARERKSNLESYPEQNIGRHLGSTIWLWVLCFCPSPSLTTPIQEETGLWHTHIFYASPNLNHKLDRLYFTTLPCTPCSSTFICSHLSNLFPFPPVLTETLKDQLLLKLHISFNKEKSL